MTTIKRRLAVLTAPDRSIEKIRIPSTASAYTVLVLNANRQMANEITGRLAEQVDECSIVYAPTLELAKLLLRKKKINLIVSSPILPDGHITGLQPLLESLTDPPDVLIFADATKKSIRLFESPRYHFLSIKQVASETDEFQSETVEALPQNNLEHRLSLLGAEVRDALNNPLQEIVALVYVARAAPSSKNTTQALNAIDGAAQNMANIVWGLEDRLYENIIGSGQQKNQICWNCAKKSGGS